MIAPVVRLGLAERFLNWYAHHTKLYIRGQQGKDWNEQRRLDQELADAIGPWLRSLVDERTADLRAELAEAKQERDDALYAHDMLRAAYQEEVERADQAEAEVAQLRAALMTIERSGAAGGAIVAERADGHACGWCRGMLTPCPVVVARKALAGAQEGGE